MLPIEQMAESVPEKQRNLERHQLKKHNQTKIGSNDEQLKLDRLHWVVEHYGFALEPSGLKRAEYSIKAYDLDAITETEQAFLKAVNRKSDRCNLAYFFGILKNIQQQHNEDAKREYCRQRYNYQEMLKMQRQQNDRQDKVTIDHIMSMLEKAVSPTHRIVKALAIREVKQWTADLSLSYSYIGALKKKLSDALGKITHLNLEQKRQAWNLLEQALNP